ncbi:electron transfer flavoprotein subunit alpha/FixB family protein [Sebaldella sp. S0638]|uniref:electron transfer flavoprotein subunit alpha/FixB family protein n=1 Tax=Sebaldella sp. S0638 TaxID=2957809 RepID=UPI00209D0647|nr:electron transfer flavoprotein subunit alpha/FixB family protein [Sebaldella sp. S0638]MCP1223621.1 electron transfer flavoprotein subunit alpha/FixB family protein [Sebaldella sp. S0638]
MTVIKNREIKKINKEDWKDILVYIETFHGEVHPVSYQMIGKAGELAKQTGYNIHGVAVGKNTDRIKDELKNYPLKKVFLYETDGNFLADSYEKMVSDCILELKPSIVLIGGTPEGRALAPLAAVNFNTGLTADCTELKLLENTDLVQIRPAFGGNIMAEILTENSRPQFATVRYNIVPPADPVYNNDIEFIHKNAGEFTQSRMTVIENIPIEKKEGIQEKEILIVAGKGIKKKEDLHLLEGLAEVLNGGIAATRGIVEKGWLAHDRQIGLSGQAVRSKLIITCGVSGSVQFMAGISGVENIIAINTDPDAGIFDMAHYPVCGDLYEIIPELIKKIKQSGGNINI